jgi:hypothetical protein
MSLAPSHVTDRKSFGSSGTRIGWFGVLAAVGLIGCEAKATADECNNACDNLKGVFLGVVEKETSREETLTKMGPTGAELARETASLFVDYLTRECVRQCNARSTRKVAECLTAAKSPEDVNRCYE